MSTRRKFIINAALGGAFLGLSAASAFATDKKGGLLVLKKGETILFQGDSITDAGRGRDRKEGLGKGYVRITRDLINKKFENLEIKVLNRGISGHKVPQLAARWDADCIKLKPDVLSIMIGVNDHWHSIGGGYKGTFATYERDFRALLKRTVAALPKTKLVICEPYALPGTSAVDASWFPVFDKYRAASKKLAGEFGAIFVPFHTMFLDAMKSTGKSAGFYAGDGVHPTGDGAKLMAETWMKLVFG